MSNATRKKATPKKTAPKPETFQQTASAELCKQRAIECLSRFFGVINPKTMALQSVPRKGATMREWLAAKNRRLNVQIKAIDAVTEYIASLEDSSEARLSSHTIHIHGGNKNLLLVAQAIEAIPTATPKDKLRECCAAFCQA